MCIPTIKKKNWNGTAKKIVNITPKPRAKVRKGHLLWEKSVRICTIAIKGKVCRSPANNTNEGAGQLSESSWRQQTQSCQIHRRLRKTTNMNIYMNPHNFKMLRPHANNRGLHTISNLYIITS
jgi:ArsR family metal-binding transcriptional regulator